MKIADFELVTQQFSQTSILLERGVSSHLGDYLKQRMGTAAAIHVIADPHTMEAYGSSDLGAGERWTQDILPARPKPEMELATRIMQHAMPADALVAIGSGTINDLVKYAAHQLKKPYVVVATAPSMNGYVSPNASIINGKHKESIACTMPMAVLMDTEILVNAPSRMIRAGIGDCLCRSTAQADWLLSHLLLDTHYVEEVFEWLLPYEKVLLQHAKFAVLGDKEIMEVLAKMLILSGLGMARAWGSYPASQGEHMIAHTMEELYGNKLPATLHGEQIAVTTLSMAERQARILASDPPPLALAKPNGRNYNHEQIEHRLGKNWRQIRDKIRTVVIPQVSLYDALSDAGCPVSPEDLGWKDPIYDQALAKARFHRDRFTFLDLD